MISFSSGFLFKQMLSFVRWKPFFNLFLIKCQTLVKRKCKFKITHLLCLANTKIFCS